MTRRRTEIPGLFLRREPFDEQRAAAFDAFLRDVFDFVPTPAADPRWERWAYFDEEGRCVAGLEACALSLLLDRVETSFAALRLVGVASTHRGHGLFRNLVDDALTWCDERGPTLLYTEDHALYTRFGFAPLAQHAFDGPAPAPILAPTRGRAAVRVDAAYALTLIDRLAPMRAPVSSHCAIRGASDLLRANLVAEGGLLAYAEDLDALLLHEIDGEELVLVDVVAAEMPTMAEIAAALGPGLRRVRTMFPPDRLDWQAMPVLDETGLMIRGVMPAAMRRPFMLPPTTSF